MCNAIIVGCFALIGAFLGAYLHRKMQHETWLLEKRATVFAKLLETLDQCIEDASRAINIGGTGDPNLYQKIIEIYKPVNLHSRVAILFVRDDSKELIEKIIKDIRSIHFSRIDNEKRRITIPEKEKELQMILEKNLMDLKWNKRNWCRRNDKRLNSE